MNKADYAKYLRSEHWKKKRLSALRRHGKVCSRCKSKTGLHVHHKTYVRLGNEHLADELPDYSGLAHAATKERVDGN